MIKAEHIIELKLIPLFFEYATKGVLPSGKRSQVAPIDCKFFLPMSMGGDDVLNQEIIEDAPPSLAGIIAKRPEARIMNALGSNWNKANFYLLENTVNGMKKNVSSDTGPDMYAGASLLTNSCCRFFRASHWWIRRQ